MSSSHETNATIRPLRRHELANVWSIDRREYIGRVYRVRGSELVLEEHDFDVPGWAPGQAEADTPRLLDCFDHGGSCEGAFEGSTLVGVSVLESRFIGRNDDQLQLKFLHISRDSRGSGLGRTLFERAATQARQLGARKLYVSATPSENTVRFYLARGCQLAQEVDEGLFALEPDDIHLELKLD